MSQDKGQHLKVDAMNKCLKLEQGKGQHMVALKRDFHIFDEILYLQNVNADVHLICKDGFVPAHICILQHTSKFMNTLLAENQRENNSDIKNILIPDFSTISVQKTIQLIYSGLTSVASKAEADFILEILDTFIIDRKNITLFKGTKSTEEPITISYCTPQNEGIKEEIILSDFDGSEDNTNLKIENVHSKACEKELLITVTSSESSESDSIRSNKNKSKNKISNDQSARTLRSRRKLRKRVQYVDSESISESENEFIEKLKMKASITQSIKGSKVSKMRKNHSSKGTSKISEESSSYSTSSYDPDNDPEYIAPTKPKIPKLSSLDYGHLTNEKERGRVSNEMVSALYNASLNFQQNPPVNLPNIHVNKPEIGFQQNRLPCPSTNTATSATALLVSLSNRLRESESERFPIRPRECLTGARTDTSMNPLMQENMFKPFTVVPNSNQFVINKKCNPTSKLLNLEPQLKYLPTQPKPGTSKCKVSSSSTRPLVPIKPKSLPGKSYKDIVNHNTYPQVEEGPAFALRCIVRYQNRDLFREDAKVCLKCKKKYTHINKAAECIRRHGLVRCYFCFFLFEDTTLLFRHYEKTHSSKCPICQEHVVFYNASMHAISKHLFEKGPERIGQEYNRNIPDPLKMSTTNWSHLQVQSKNESLISHGIEITNSIIEVREEEKDEEKTSDTFTIQTMETPNTIQTMETPNTIQTMETPDTNLVIVEPIPIIKTEIEIVEDVEIFS